MNGDDCEDTTSGAAALAVTTPELEKATDVWTPTTVTAQYESTATFVPRDNLMMARAGRMTRESERPT